MQNFLDSKLESADSNTVAIQSQRTTQNISLLTDFYQITMAYAAWKNGHDEKEGVFDMYFRKNPFEGGYAIHGGLSSVLNFVNQFKITQEQCRYLSTLQDNSGQPLFDSLFIDYLGNLKLTVDIDAVPEGRVVFANEPLYRVQGPILQCQLIETALLNMVNFETLIATKASRVRMAAGSDTVLEFGLRRAQGLDGGLSASRAAYIGGVDATSNVMAGQLFGIPLRGTHAHSWVMSFDDELEAFQKFADAMPTNCILLVDTYETLDGVRKAIQVGLRMKSQGFSLLGIRLDSGDLAYLSVEARKLLDEAGLNDVKIVASNDLDENLIQSLKSQGARIDIWGIGTKLVTAYDQPALGGVFKLVAVKNEKGEYLDKIKISEQSAKTTHPGLHQVRRFFKGQHFAGDMIYDLRFQPSQRPMMVDPVDSNRRKSFDGSETFEDLLVPVVRKGQVVSPFVTLDEIRRVREKDLSNLHPTIRRFTFPHNYPVGLEASFHQHKFQMILKLRGFSEGGLQ